MYICGMAIPVPEHNLVAYRRWAENSAALFKSYGCIEIVEAWEDFVPDGQTTDFRRAVKAEPGEKIVLAWQIWPNKESLTAAEERMHADGVLDIDDPVPFAAERLIAGCFTPIATMGRG